MSVCFKYIGYVKRKNSNSTSREEVVEIQVDKKYEEGLKGIEGFSHEIIIYHLHLAEFDGKPFSI